MKTKEERETNHPRFEKETENCENDKDRKKLPLKNSRDGRQTDKARERDSKSNRRNQRKKHRRNERG